MQRINRKCQLEKFMEEEAEIKAKREAEEQQAEQDAVMRRGAQLMEMADPEKAMADQIREETIAKHDKYIRDVIQKACDNSVRKGKSIGKSQSFLTARSSRPR